MAAQGKPLSNEIKKMMIVLKGYFDRTKNDPDEHKCSSVNRVAHALDVGVASVKRVMAEYTKEPDFLEKQSVTRRGRPNRILPDSLQTLTREYVRKANQEGRHITLEMLMDHLGTCENDQEFSVRTLGRALDRWGFTFGKGTRSQHLKEKDHVIAARQRYLREKRRNRKGTETIRPEVYLDESYVNKNHSSDFIWHLDEDGPWVQKPTGKGERLIIINAITKDGWIPGAKLVFKSTRKTGDYHGQMNNGLFVKWFSEKLIPNLPENSLIMMDNASYHNVLSEHSAPTPSCKKEKIASWLLANGLPLKDDCLKAEMIEILVKIGPQPTYALDELAEKYGHKVVRTPPYHPELQPIETCWAVLKNHIARNSNFTMANLIIQLDEAFNKVTSKTCKSLIRKMREVEDNYWKEDLVLDCQN